MSLAALDSSSLSARAWLWQAPGAHVVSGAPWDWTRALGTRVNFQFEVQVSGYFTNPSADATRVWGGK